MRIAIVEDEAIIARRLERMVRGMVAGATIEHAASFDDALRVTRAPIDLLFLDLNLNGRDGFELLSEAAASRFQTVVVSAHHDQALRAFEYGVTDFVAKPWTEERLRRALDRVVNVARASARAEGEPQLETARAEARAEGQPQLETARAEARAEGEPQLETARAEARAEGQPQLETARAEARATLTLFIRKGRELRAIAVEDVAVIRGADDYSELHLANGSVHLHAKSLSALESCLPANFLRVHRSWIVNLARVRGTRSDAVVMHDGAVVPVGRVYRATLRRRRSAAPPARS